MRCAPFCYIFTVSDATFVAGLTVATIDATSE